MGTLACSQARGSATLAQVPQAHLSRDGTAYSGLGPPLTIPISKKTPTGMSTVSVWHTKFLKAPSSQMCHAENQNEPSCHLGQAG